MSFIDTLRGKSRTKISTSTLRKVNLAVAGLLLVQAVLIVVLSEAGHGLRTITTSFSAVDPIATSTAEHTILGQASARFFDLNLSYLIAAFLVAGAVAYLLSATKLRANYEKDLKKAVNRIRWWGYSVWGGLAVATVAILIGIVDFGTLLAILGLIALSGLLTLRSELAQKSQNKKPAGTVEFRLASLAGCLPWVIMAVSLLSAAVNAEGVQGFVYAIYASLLMLFALTALAKWMKLHKKGAWADYSFAELSYSVLAFVSMTALTWQVFAGALR